MLRRFSYLAIAFVVSFAATAQSPNTPFGSHDRIRGEWTYRSFHDRPALVGDSAEKALDLIFAEAKMVFEPPSGPALKGKIDWPGGGLDLAGEIKPGGAGTFVIDLVGSGRPGTSTDGWEYDYYAALAHHWPSGVDQRPALVGSVLRAKSHGSAKAGYVASFIAVKGP